MSRPKKPEDPSKWPACAAAHLRQRLQAIFSVRAARLGTLHELTKLAPTAIIADMLGYSATTIERHGVASASTYAQYVARRRRTPR